MIKAIIVDDEPSAAEIISLLLKAEAPEIEVCSICANIDDAVKDIALHDPGILFLDVELADGTGFDILEKFAVLNARVIFITAYEHYSLKAIKHHAFDYILKPIDPNEFRKTLKDILGTIKTASPEHHLLDYFKKLEAKKIALPTRNGYKYHDIDSIIFLEAEGSYTRVYFTGGQDALISKGLREFETPLLDKGFLRVHKSYFVNIRHVTELRKDDGGYLLMSNAKTVPLSAKNREDVFDELRHFIRLV
jgi:two-component system LytT family response regulator